MDIQTHSKLLDSTKQIFVKIRIINTISCQHCFLHFFLFLFSLCYHEEHFSQNSQSTHSHVKWLLHVKLMFRHKVDSFSVMNNKNYDSFGLIIDSTVITIWLYRICHCIIKQYNHLHDIELSFQFGQRSMCIDSAYQILCCETLK